LLQLERVKARLVGSAALPWPTPRSAGFCTKLTTVDEKQGEREAAADLAKEEALPSSSSLPAQNEPASARRTLSLFAALLSER